MSYMEVYDSHILADAKTPYENILETLEGKMLVGDKTAMENLDSYFLP